MFTIKICGITRIADAVAAAEAGADAVGLNFFPQSVRYIEPALAAEITAALPVNVARVGLFVNATVEQVVELQRALRLDYVQLHGDESPDWLQSLARQAPEARLIRALRWAGSDWQPLGDYLATCEELNVSLSAVLIDAFRPGHYGGTGAMLPWDAIARRPAALDKQPLILAGGLTPENVAEAIRIAHPAGVDTASGVESAPGQKCPQKMAAFVAAARAALPRGG